MCEPDEGGGEYDRAAPLIERSLALAEHLDLAETWLHGLNNKSILLGRQGRPREARLIIEGALAAALEEELPDVTLRTYNNLIANVWLAEDWPLCATLTERAVALAHRVGHREWELSLKRAKYQRKAASS